MDSAGPAPPAPASSSNEPTPPPAKRPRNGSTDGDSGKGRAKGSKATSCRECIRLKLKCSREWPCTSCVRRKVASICPDGELPHRDAFLQQETIKELLEQNKALTAALQQQQQQSPVSQYAHASLPLPPLPQQAPAPVSSSLQSLLLSPLAAATAPSPPFDRDSPDAPGNPLEAAAGRGPGVMETEGTAARFHGRGAGALFLIDAGATDSPDLYPGELLFPFASAPATSAMLPPDQYPPFDAALGYIDVYFTEVDWMYQPCARTFVDSDLRQLYSGPSNTANPCCLHPHRLATLLTIFALALTFSQNLEIASRRRNPQATAFFNAAAALLTSPPYNFMSRPTVAAVKCLHLMVSYLFCSGDREGARSAWTILGLASRAAQALGLHKNCAAWGLSADVTEERARAWWEIFVYDLLQSLNSHLSILPLLLGPVKKMAPGGVDALTKRAETVRSGGMSAIVDAVSTAGCSAKTNSSRPLSKAAVRASLLASQPEGYAQACLALAHADDPDYSAITAPTLIVAGSEDKTSPQATIDFLSGAIKGAKVAKVEDIGHWHELEDVDAVASEIKNFVQ